MIDFTKINNFFFIGIAGTGMSAIAQFLAMQGHNVAGSDRLFAREPEHPTGKKLKKLGIKIYPQGKSVIPDNSIICVSTAIEDTVPEMKTAKEKNLTILHRSDILNLIANQFKSIAVAGTSGKSTTTAMVFQILDSAGLAPSFIGGAGLSSLKEKGLIGNAWLGKGEWLVFEADESDGTIVKYTPNIGILLNIDIDHKDIETLDKLFSQFVKASKTLIASSHLKDKNFVASKNNTIYFGKSKDADYRVSNIKQDLAKLKFKINSQDFTIPTIGIFNATNAAAAVAATSITGVGLKEASSALAEYRGIERRMEIVEHNNMFTVIDDYAHNPAKIKAALESAQDMSDRVIAWFQPHGYAPMRFFGDELVNVLSGTLRKNDIFIMSEIYYAGGSARRDISAEDYTKKLAQKGLNAIFVKDRKKIVNLISENITHQTVILLMGARDPSLNEFAFYVAENLKKNFFNKIID